MFEFLAASDRRRLEKTLEKLRGHDVSAWVLTGGLALEWQLSRRGVAPKARVLNDLDFIVATFDDVPRSLGRDFLLRHVHPYDPPAKTLLQAIDRETALRTDVFRAYGGVIERSDTASGWPRVVALADLVARLGRLSWDVVDGRALPRKYAQDFARALAFVAQDNVETAWRDHRKPFMAESFADAVRTVKAAMTARPDLLIEPDWYSVTPETCPRCHAVAGLPLAEPERVLEVMGYC